MTATITCPMCQADVVLEADDARALCADCHDLDEAELTTELQKRVERALWGALRALEDQGAYTRWQRQRGKDVPHDAREADDAARLLRHILSSGS